MVENKHGCLLSVFIEIVWSFYAAQASDLASAIVGLMTNVSEAKQGQLHLKENFLPLFSSFRRSLGWLEFICLHELLVSR